MKYKSIDRVFHLFYNSYAYNYAEDSMKVIIIGAGPAGLSSAYQLLKAGYDVEIFEGSPHIGGLSRSIQLWGQTVDIGPHRFFSNDTRVNKFWHEIIENNYTIVNRLTRIHYRNSFFYYPLRPFNAFFNLGIIDSISCVFSYALQKFKKFEPVSFEDWVVSRFGRKLFTIFFKTYSEKVWGISCQDLDADWASQRIAKLSLYQAIKTALSRSSKTKIKTLIDQFNYPKNGTGAFYELLSEKIKLLGGKIHLEVPIEEVLVQSTGSIQKAIGIVCRNASSGPGSVDSENTGCLRQVPADFVISTMPLTQMVKSIKQTPSLVSQACDQLRYRNTILVYIELDTLSLFPDNWIYIHSPLVEHGRITNFRNWCPSLHQGKESTIICMEFWCFDEDSIWTKNNTDIEVQSKLELEKINILKEGIKILNYKVVKVPRSYPVYQTGYMKHLKKIQNYVSSIDSLFAIGRYGAFKYNNQDHSILMGLLSAEEIISGQSQNLWQINTDSEYQEGDSKLSTAPKEVPSSRIKKGPQNFS